jgi:hypothetical protein
MTETNTVSSHDENTTQLSTPIIIAMIVTVLVLLIGGITIAVGRHQLVKNQEAAAKVVADKVIADMGKQDTAAILKLSDSKFQKQYTAKELSDKLTFNYQANPLKFGEVYGNYKPKVNRSIVANNSAGQHTGFIYVYDKLKVPFYVRLDLTKAPGSDQWKLNALAASSNESKLQ